MIAVYEYAKGCTLNNLPKKIAADTFTKTMKSPVGVYTYAKYGTS